MLNSRAELWQESQRLTSELLLFKEVLAYWRAYVRACNGLAEFYSMQDGFDALAEIIRLQSHTSNQYSALICNRIDQLRMQLDTVTYNLAQLDDLEPLPVHVQYRFGFE